MPFLHVLPKSTSNSSLNNLIRSSELDILFMFHGHFLFMKWKIIETVYLSWECFHLLSRMFSILALGLQLQTTLALQVCHQSLSAVRFWGHIPGACSTWRLFGFCLAWRWGGWEWAEAICTLTYPWRILVALAIGDMVLAYSSRKETSTGFSRSHI